jgi:kynurenine 3-monooxygenase
MSEKVTLVGGGLAGSLMSIYLAKRGYEVYIYERRADMRSGNYVGGRSINLALSTRGFILWMARSSISLMAKMGRRFIVYRVDS